MASRKCLTAFLYRAFVMYVYLTVQVTKSQPNTIIVATTPVRTTTITVTPTIGQSVELQCSGSGVGKRWYTTGSEVTPTPNKITTSTGTIRILAFSSFAPSHAGTYTCLASSRGDTQTKTTYPVVLVNPSAINTLTVGRTDGPITTITITPTLSQPVQLECERMGVPKDWFTGDPRSKVESTEGEISTSGGNYRTLLISSFKPIHATTYNCIVDHKTNMSTVYPVVLETPPPPNAITSPSQVQSVMLTGSGTSLNVSWTVVTGTAIGYVVRYSTDRGTETDPLSDAMKRSGITATSTTLTGLQSGTTYYVWVAAEILGAGVQGPYSMRMMIKVLPQVQDVTVTKGVSDGSPSLTVSWTAVSGSEITYTVRYSTSSGTETEPPAGASTVSGITGTSTTLSELTQGTVYYIWVAAVSSGGQGPYSTRVSETTFEVPNKVSLTANQVTRKVTSNKPSLRVTWNAPSSDRTITNYKIQYRRGTSGSWMERTSNGNTTMVTIESLQLGTKYQVRVTAVSDLGDGAWSNIVSNTTFNVPNMVSLTTNQVTRTVTSNNPSLQVTWSAPSSDRTITSYKIQYRSGTSGNWMERTSNGNTTMVTIESLQLGTKYQVQVRAVSDLGDGAWSNTVSRTTFNVPNKVALTTNQVTRTVTSNKPSLGVTWSAPSSNRPITSYKIGYRSGTSGSWMERTSNGNATMVTIESLQLGTKYQVRVTAVSDLGDGAWSNIVSNTTFNVPNMVSLTTNQVTRTVTSNKPSLQVTWSAPLSDHTITSYKIGYRRGTSGNWMKRTSNGNTTMVAIENLQLGTMYQVRVRAVSDLGDGTWSDIVSKTAFNVPNKVSLTANQVTRTVTSNNPSLQVTWSAPSSDRPITSYKIGYRSGTSGSWMGRTLNGNTRMVTVENIQLGTLYQVRVRAVSDLGNGAWSDVVSKTTFNVPNKVSLTTNQVTRTVTLNKPSLGVTWSAPSSNRPITSYKIQYRRGTSGIWMERTSNGNTRMVTLVNLQLGTMYQVRVRVVSDLGDGAWSNVVNKTTFNVPGAPTNLIISPPSGSCDRLMVTWTAPTNTGGLPVKYRVYRSSDKIHSNRATTSTTWSGLTTNTQYTVRVVAFNDLGDGGEVTGTGRTRPQTPSISSLSASSSTQLIITLTAPDRSYSLTYKCTISTTVSGLPPKTVTDTVLQYTVDGLSPYVTYTVECTSLNGEDSCDSSMDTIRMLSDVPSGPPLNVMADTSSTSTTLRWDPPTERDRNGEITGYVVKYKLTTSTSYINELVLQGSENSFTITDLMEGNEYTLSIGAMTVNGTGPNATIVITTVPTVESLRVSNVTTNTINITWDAPLDGYTVDEPYAEATDSSTEGVPVRTPVRAGTLTWHKFSSCDSFREYKVFVRLVSAGGDKSSNRTITVRTLGKAPTGMPAFASSVAEKRSIFIGWSAPDLWKRNGIITHYIIEWEETGNLTTLNYSVPNPTFNTTNRLSYNFTGMRPFTTYNFRIAAVNINGTGPFSNNTKIGTDEDVPGAVEYLIIQSKAESKVVFQWIPPASPNGIILQYHISYGTLNSNVTFNTTVGSNTGTFHVMALSPGVPYVISISAKTVAGKGKKREMIFFLKELSPNTSVNEESIETTWFGNSLIISWEPLTLHEARGFPVYYIYLNDSSGPVKREIEPTANTTESSIVINGLDSSQTYMLAIGVATGGGNLTGPVGESVTMQGLATDDVDEVNIIPTIISLIVVLLVIGGLTVVIIIGVKIKRKSGKSERFWIKIKKKNESSIEMSDLHQVYEAGTLEPIPIEHFTNHVRYMHLDGDSRFETEYDIIKEKDPKGNDDIAREHTSKNRYVNIFTYNHSRVKLSIPDKDNDDYINASYIHGYDREDAYIASQGPTQNTIADFLQMLLDHRSPIVVMLTLHVEKTKTKCEKYWAANDGDVFEPGRNLQVMVISCIQFSDYELREITITTLNSSVRPHTFKHFLYTSWPDHGVPQHPSAMIKFVQQVRKVYNNSSAPMIVHCSAGVGRTGTFIAIDAMMQRLKNVANLNINEFVIKMRARRTFMVQNQDQYSFLHDALNDYISSGDTAIVAHELMRFIVRNNELDGESKKTGFQEQFQLLGAMSKTVSATDKSNAAKSMISKKNRYKDRFPYTNKHIRVSGKSSTNAADYINASFCSSYSRQKAFIAAQAPLPSTKEDFWTVINQLRIRTVVMLCGVTEKIDPPCVQFWPDERTRTAQFGDIEVTYMIDNSKNCDGYVRYNFQVQDIKMPSPLEVELYYFDQWNPSEAPPMTSLLRLMGDVESINKKKTKPTVVMCDDGMGRTGVFITAMSEIERVKLEGEIDIFQTVKAIRVQRPNMVSTVDQYKLCHEILQAYLDSFDTYANFKGV